MAHFKVHVSSSPSSSSITNDAHHLTLSSRSCLGDYLALSSCPRPTLKRKRRQQETNNISSLLDLSSYPNETNVCLHLSLAFCNCIQIANKHKFAHQETDGSTKNNTCSDVDVDVDASVTVVGTSSDSSTSRDDPWKIKKVLSTTDLGNNSRLLLKRELAKKWVVPFVDKAEAEKDGVKVPVFDVDTQTLRSLVFKIRPSNQRHVFIDTWRKDFVKIRNLKTGDEIGLKWDQDDKKFDFSVLRRA